MQRIATLRFLPATHVVMHLRRWAWFLAALDPTNRPLVLPNGTNAIARVEDGAAQGIVAS